MVEPLLGMSGVGPEEIQHFPEGKKRRLQNQVLLSEQRTLVRDGHPLELTVSDKVFVEERKGIL